MNYKKYFSSIAPELQQVEEIILREMHTEVPQLYAASTHLVASGGKKLRPAFLLLTGKLFREDIDFMLPMAAAIEIAHVGTLIHDDVVDASDLRRGVETVRVRYGERMSIYAGNFLFARALQLATSFHDKQILQRLTEGCCQICSGEIQQLSGAFSFQQNFKDYLRRIQKKTALLISLSCEIGAMLCQATEEQIRAMRRYGHNLGMAFQIGDDILDFTSNEKILGKSVGSDLRNGLLTYPILYVLQYVPEGKVIKEILQSGHQAKPSDEDLHKILFIVKKFGGIDAAIRLAERYAQHAIKCLRQFPPSLAKKNLTEIASEIAHRKF